MIRERDVEKKATDWAKKNGWLTYKFVSPSNRGVPDRVFIKDGHVVFIEFKAPGKKPTPLQAQTIRKLKDAECEVHVFDDAESAIYALSL